MKKKYVVSLLLCFLVVSGQTQLFSHKTGTTLVLDENLREHICSQKRLFKGQKKFFKGQKNFNVQRCSCHRTKAAGNSGWAKSVLNWTMTSLLTVGMFFVKDHIKSHNKKA